MYLPLIWITQSSNKVFGKCGTMRRLWFSRFNFCTQMTSDAHMCERPLLFGFLLAQKIGTGCGTCLSSGYWEWNFVFFVCSTHWNGEKWNQIRKERESRTTGSLNYLWHQATSTLISIFNLMTWARKYRFYCIFSLRVSLANSPLLFCLFANFFWCISLDFADIL